MLCLSSGPRNARGLPEHGQTQPLLPPWDQRDKRGLFRLVFAVSSGGATCSTVPTHAWGSKQCLNRVQRLRWAQGRRKLLLLHGFCLLTRVEALRVLAHAPSPFWE